MKFILASKKSLLHTWAVSFLKASIALSITLNIYASISILKMIDIGRFEPMPIKKYYLNANDLVLSFLPPCKKSQNN